MKTYDETFSFTGSEPAMGNPLNFISDILFRHADRNDQQTVLDVQSRNLPPLPRHWHSLPHAFLLQARRRPHALAVEDSTGTKLTYMQLLVRSIALAHLLQERLNSSVCVGILLPPCAGAVIANLALAMLGKVSVNLNYTTGQKAFDLYVKDCNLHHIISAVPVLKRLPIDIRVNIIKLEEVQHQANLIDKVRAFIESEIAPDFFLERLLPGLKPSAQADLRQLFLTSHEVNNASAATNNCGSINLLTQPAAVIFTSGSTGSPKGVVLSHSNILSNIHAIRLQGHVKSGEKVLGIIPFFHSFGFTMTLWAPLCLGETVIYHYDPLDARRIAALCQSTEATCIICTPTMFSNFLRRCGPEPFRSLSTCILGGEKVKQTQLSLIEDGLGIKPLEGYGLTETSPVVACNVAENVRLEDGRIVSGTRFGTVGLPLPGTEIRILDAGTKQELARGKEGLIQVKGPQVMLGYLKRPEDTARVIKQGWFDTGDIGLIDSDGFLKITGRVNQFSKIAGEMVSHLVVEEELQKVLDAGADCLSVTSVPDEQRGERLIVVMANQNKTPDWIVNELNRSSLPKLWIPDREGFISLDQMPILPNGKLDLKRIKEIAEKRFAR